MINLIIIFGVAFLISSYQIYRCLKYLKKSIRLKQTYEDKIEQGSMKLWEYIFMFVPIRYKDYYDSVGSQGGNFYVTPLVGFFALFGNKLSWVGVLICVLFSLGGGFFKLFHRILLRIPFYWGYFASLFVVWASVEEIRTFNLNNRNLTLLTLILGILLLFNKDWLPVYPYNMWAKRPSEWFNTPLLRYLETYAKGYRVNNLPYPVYHGQINHIKSMGYMGGNHDAKIGKFRGMSRLGAGGYDWFDFLPDGKKLDKYGVKYHIGYKPLHPKWKKVEGFDLWENTNL